MTFLYLNIRRQTEKISSNPLYGFNFHFSWQIDPGI